MIMNSSYLNMDIAVTMVDTRFSNCVQLFFTLFFMDACLKFYISGLVTNYWEGRGATKRGEGGK